MENSRDIYLAAVMNGSAEPSRPALDRRAMDALVNAVEARLREHGAQMDRRLADLEATMALELDTLHQQEGTIVGRAETAIEHAHKHWNEQTLALWQQRKDDLGALRQEFTDFQRQFGGELQTAVQKEVACQVDVAVGGLRKLVDAVAAERLDPLVAEMETRNREIAGMRQRLVENERHVLEFALGMGEWFRELAGRICAPRIPDPPHPAIPVGSTCGN